MVSQSIVLTLGGELSAKRGVWWRRPETLGCRETICRNQTTYQLEFGWPLSGPCTGTVERPSCLVSKDISMTYRLG